MECKSYASWKVLSFVYSICNCSKMLRKKHKGLFKPTYWFTLIQHCWPRLNTILGDVGWCRMMLDQVWSNLTMQFWGKCNFSPLICSISLPISSMNLLGFWTSMFSLRLMLSLPLMLLDLWLKLAGVLMKYKICLDINDWLSTILPKQTSKRTEICM